MMHKKIYNNIKYMRCMVLEIAENNSTISKTIEKVGA
jgi:hypothetical protein